MKPKPAAGVEVKDSPSKPSSVKDGLAKEYPAKENTSRKTKRLRPQSMDLDESRPSTPVQPGKSETSKQAGLPKSQTPSKILPPNLLLPSFRNT